MGFFTRMAVLLGLKRKTPKQVVNEIVKDVKAESERQKQERRANRNRKATARSGERPFGNRSLHSHRNQSEDFTTGYLPVDDSPSHSYSSGDFSSGCSSFSSGGSDYSSSSDSSSSCGGSDW